MYPILKSFTLCVVFPILAIAAAGAAIGIALYAPAIIAYGLMWIGIPEITAMAIGFISWLWVIGYVAYKS